MVNDRRAHGNDANPERATAASGTPPRVPPDSDLGAGCGSLRVASQAVVRPVATTSSGKKIYGKMRVNG